MSFTRNNISYNFGALPKFDPFRLDKTILHKNMVSFVYSSIVASNVHFNISGCSENFCFWLCYKPQITILMIWGFLTIIPCMDVSKKDVPGSCGSLHVLCRLEPHPSGDSVQGPYRIVGVWLIFRSY